MFDSQQFSGSIDILLPALVTSDLEGAVDRRTRGEGVCLGKQDLVSEKEILPSVKPMVFAEHYPEIRIIFPHDVLSAEEARKGWLGNEWSYLAFIQAYLPRKDNW